MWEKENKMIKSKSFLKALFKPFASKPSKDPNEVDLEKLAAQEQKHFPFEILVAATNNFHPSLKLGEGGFGPVYKGKLGDGREIAVKKLSRSSAQGKKEFLSESKLLARVQHRNVVNLLGYCVHAQERLLVYQYVVNQSLDKILFSNFFFFPSFLLQYSISTPIIYIYCSSTSWLLPHIPPYLIIYEGIASRKKREVQSVFYTSYMFDGFGLESDDRRGGGGDEFNWKRRYDVITGIAKGLVYLHEEAHCRIIHRDIKASNILLDDKWVPKIGDFGMARLYPEEQTHINTRVAGTNGYMAPEYLLHGHLSEKADVFSFGVVVLELITGQKNSRFNRDPHCRSLLEWVYKLYKKQRISEVVDPRIPASDHQMQVEMEMCIQIGLLCVQSDPRTRPHMSHVVLILSNKKPTTLEQPQRPGNPGTSYTLSRPPPTATAIASSSSSSSSALSQSFGSTVTSTATATATS